MRHFVRDWSKEGRPERDATYLPLLEALERHLPLVPGHNPGSSSSSAVPPQPQRQQQAFHGLGFASAPPPWASRPRVLCPGCGLFRLCFEVAYRGYTVEGNEFSYHMLQGAKWIMDGKATEQGQVGIHPFVLDMNHRVGQQDQLKEIRVPDICLSTVREDLFRQGRRMGRMTMAAGEFVDVYEHQKAAWDAHRGFWRRGVFLDKSWDAVLTPFFLDTAQNVFLYIRTIADILRPGGLWVNFGSLVFHYPELLGDRDQEISWEELRPAIEKYFEFKEEDTTRKAHYAAGQYDAIYFVAVRKAGVPTEGKSFPVFS